MFFAKFEISNSIVGCCKRFPNLASKYDCSNLNLRDMTLFYHFFKMKINLGQELNCSTL